MKRLFFHIAIGVSVLYAPWYITAVLMVVLACITGFFLEVFLWAFFVDLFYGSTVSLWGVSYVFSLVAIVLLPIIASIRRRVSW